MSSATAPYPYFNGITYNPSFFSSSSTGLTQGQANLLYLKKTTADTATAIETFSGGILSNSLKTIAASDILDIATTQTSGAINIGSLPSRTGNINIGYAISAPTGLGYNINIGNILSNTSIGGKYIELAAASSGISLSTSGTLDLIATAYNMGTTLLSATNINIGTAGKSTTTIYGGISTAGLLTANGGLTMGGSNHITLTTATGTIPAINQLGYAIVKGPSTATVTNTLTALIGANFISGANGTGTYIVTYTVNTTGAWVGATSGYMTFSYTQGGTTSVAMLGTPPLLSYSTGLNGASWVVIVQVTASGPLIQLNAITNASGNSVAVSSSAVYTKIA
jgi:hypothetical protein